MKGRFVFKGHPGTMYLIFFVVLGLLAGADRGGWWPAVGAGMMLLLFGPMYLIGAYRKPKEPTP